MNFLPNYIQSDQVNEEGGDVFVLEQNPKEEAPVYSATRPLLNNYNLIGHTGPVNAIEFSHDGSFLVSGDSYRRLLLWNINDTPIDERNTLQPTAIGAIQYPISCLITSRRSLRIFSGAMHSNRVFIHDLLTYV